MAADTIRFIVTVAIVVYKGLIPVVGRMLTSEAQWEMRQIDWGTMDEVPNAVYNAFAASEYSDGMVQGVTLVQFPKREAVVSVVVGMANTQTRYQLLFTLDGGLEDERNATYFNNLLGAEVFL